MSIKPTHLPVPMARQEDRRCSCSNLSTQPLARATGTRQAFPAARRALLRAGHYIMTKIVTGDIDERRNH